MESKSFWRVSLFSQQKKIMYFSNIVHRYGHFTINFLKHIIQFSRVNTMLIMNRIAIYYILIIIVSLLFLILLVRDPKRNETFPIVKRERESEKSEYFSSKFFHFFFVACGELSGK